MIGFDKHQKTWTKAEAKALLGRTVHTNARTTVKIVALYAEGPDSYLVADERGHGYAKSDTNGLYCWLEESEEAP